MNDQQPSESVDLSTASPNQPALTDAEDRTGDGATSSTPAAAPPPPAVPETPETPEDRFARRRAAEAEFDVEIEALSGEIAQIDSQIAEMRRRRALVEQQRDDLIVKKAAVLPPLSPVEVAMQSSRASQEQRIQRARTNDEVSAALGMGIPRRRAPIDDVRHGRPGFGSGRKVVPPVAAAGVNSAAG